jgi:hypothetical protein
MDPRVNVICMKWGSPVRPRVREHLRRGVARHLKRPHRFVCFTDDATGTGRGRRGADRCRTWACPAGQNDLRWRKLAVFREQLADLQGTTLFLDLDLVVVDDLEPFFELPGRFLIIRDDDLFRPSRCAALNPERDRFLHSVGNSSVFRFEIGAHRYILDAYLADPKGGRAALRDLAAVPERPARRPWGPGVLAHGAGA